MRTRTYAAVVGLSIALTTAACGSSSSTKSGSSAPTAAAPSSAATQPPASSPASGPATAGTIRIGLANMDTGTTSFPAIEQAAQAAATYLNKTQGGLAGKHIDIVSCDMKNDDQSAQKCGQEFANDATIPFVLLGATLNGGPFYSAMQAAHKPVLGALGVVPADYAPAGVYFYYPGSTYYQTLGTYLTSLKLHSYSLVYESNASSTYGTQVIAKMLTSTGASVKSTSIPPAASDVTASIANAGIATADAAVLITNASCPQIVAAEKSLGIKAKRTIVVETCLPPSAIAANPSDYEGWDYYNTFKLGASGAAGGPDVAAFLKGFSAYGPGGTPGTWAELGWGLTLTTAKIFSGASTITPASADAAFRGYHGAVVMGPNSVSCPGPAPYTSTCAQGAEIYQVNGGKLIPQPF